MVLFNKRNPINGAGLY